MQPTGREMRSWLMQNGDEEEADKILAEETQKMHEFVMNEFRPKSREERLAEEADRKNPTVKHIYGGVAPIIPKERDLVKAWRPGPSGMWEFAAGVVHRVHAEDNTCTVQFVPDQHRFRLPMRSVQLVLNATPVYPNQRLAPGHRLPTLEEIQQRERESDETRWHLGIPPHMPLPGTQDNAALLPGESLGADGVPTMQATHWGMPAATIDALRQRSIPHTQVSGTFGPHFYSDLYRNRFYPQQGRRIEDLRAGVSKLATQPVREPRVVGQVYIPLQGPPQEMDMSTGEWRILESTAPGDSVEGWLD